MPPSQSPGRGSAADGPFSPSLSPRRAPLPPLPELGDDMKPTEGGASLLRTWAQFQTKPTALGEEPLDLQVFDIYRCGLAGNSVLKRLNSDSSVFRTRRVAWTGLVKTRIWIHFQTWWILYSGRLRDCRRRERGRLISCFRTASTRLDLSTNSKSFPESSIFLPRTDKSCPGSGAQHIGVFGRTGQVKCYPDSRGWVGRAARTFVLFNSDAVFHW
jgi:hypothetical protein